MNKFFIIICLFLLVETTFSQGKEDKVTNEEILLEIKVFEAKTEERFKAIDQRFEQVDQRFEQVDKRFEQVDKRFEQVDKQFEQFTTFMWILAVIFIGIASVTIGFALWDRRTMIRPFETKVTQIEKSFEKFRDDKRVEKIIAVLRELAKSDNRLAEALKTINLL